MMSGRRREVFEPRVDELTKAWCGDEQDARRGEPRPQHINTGGGDREIKEKTQGTMELRSSLAQWVPPDAQTRLIKMLQNEPARDPRSLLRTKTLSVH